MAREFLNRNPEKQELNQYWYSELTLQTLSQEIEDLSTGPVTTIACISTPSVHFALSRNLQANSWIFDLDQKFKTQTNYVCYDFNDPLGFEESFQNFFDLVVVDPPFITYEVWEKYSRTIKSLLKPNGLMILSSIAENASMLNELLGAKVMPFQPSIPNLVYQYNFFANYDSQRLSQLNPEIPQ